MTRRRSTRLATAVLGALTATALAPAAAHAQPATAPAAPPTAAMAVGRATSPSATPAAAAATQRPAPTSVRELGLGPARTRVAARTASGAAGVVLAELPARTVARFSTVGLTWSTASRGPAPTVQVSTRSRGRWSAWQRIGAGPRVSEGEARPGTDPIWVGDSDGVRARVIGAPDTSVSDPRLALVDSPVTAADAAAAASAAPAAGTGSTASTTRAPSRTSSSTTTGATTGTSTSATTASADTASADTARGVTGRPSIVRRASWGADESWRRINDGCGTPVYDRTIEAAIVHHTAGSNSYSASQSPSIVRGIYAYHVKSQGWCDVGYSFLVDRYGTIFEGRYGGIDQPVHGAHATSWNTNTTGVSMMGNYDTASPSSALVDAANRIIAWKLSLHDRDPLTKVTLAGRTIYRIAGHRDVMSTACPGRYGYARLSGMRAAVKKRIDAAAPGGPAAPPSTAYQIIGPDRLYDSRSSTPILAGITREIQVMGRAGVPQTGVGAVVVNITSTESTRNGYLTAYPADQPRPTVSTLSYLAGRSTANAAVVKLSPGGAITVYAHATSHVVIDVQGYLPTGSADLAATTPSRVLDTRTAGVRLGAGQSLTVPVLPAGMPPASYTGAAVNLTATGAGSAGTLTVTPSGAAAGAATSLHFPAGSSIASHAVSRLGSDGAVRITASAPTHVVLDLQGVVPSASRLTTLVPAVLLDTRSGVGAAAAPVPARGTVTFTVAGQGGVPPTGARAVVLAVAAVRPQASGYLTVYPAGMPRPTASTLNHPAGVPVASTVVVPIGSAGRVSVYSYAATDVTASVVGYLR